MIDRNASRLLVLFMQRFTDLQEKHLVGIHKTMRETVDGIMSNINLISEKTRKKTEEANDDLMKTNTEPDLDMVTAINHTQSEVENYVKSPRGSTPGGSEGAKSLEEMRKKMIKTSGLFLGTWNTLLL